MREAIVCGALRATARSQYLQFHPCAKNGRARGECCYFCMDETIPCNFIRKHSDSEIRISQTHTMTNKQITCSTNAYAAKKKDQSLRQPTFAIRVRPMAWQKYIFEQMTSLQSNGIIAAMSRVAPTNHRPMKKHLKCNAQMNPFAAHIIIWKSNYIHFKWISIKCKYIIIIFFNCTFELVVSL